VVRPALHVCLALFAVLVTGGCGGNPPAKPERAADRESGTQPAAAQPTAPRPTLYALDDVRTALIGPQEVGRHVRTQPPRFPGLTRAGAPMCSASTIRLPGSPTTLGRQLEASPRGYLGAHYIQLVAVYASPASASRALARIGARAAGCPRKRHLPGKRINKRLYTLDHTDTWRLTRDTIGGWRHLRGFEKRVEPPSSSRYNAFYDVYDYVHKGNLLIASLYWERVEPTATPGTTIATRATRVLHKQLGLIDRA
jgi:hypothetical protein